MTEQQYPPSNQPPAAQLIPPKPTAAEQAYASAQEQPFQQQSHQQGVPPQPYQQSYQQQPYQQQPYQQQPYQPAQQNNPLGEIPSDQVYPTPVPEAEYSFAPPPYQQQAYQQPLQQSYTLNAQTPYQQQPYQQPAVQQQPTQQPYQQGVPQQAHLQQVQTPQPYQQQVPQGQPVYQIPVQPAQPVGQVQPYQQARQSSLTPPQQPTSQYPYYQQQPGQPQWQQQYTQTHVTNSFALYLTLSILEILFCGGLLAVPGLIYAVMMNTAYKQGNTALYLKNRNTSRVWLIVAACLGLLANIFYITSVFS